MVTELSLISSGWRYQQNAIASVLFGAAFVKNKFKPAFFTIFVESMLVLVLCLIDRIAVRFFLKRS